VTVTKSYFVNLVSRICIGLIALLAIGARADSNQMQLAYELPSHVLGRPVAATPSFWERLELTFSERSERVFTDRFHSLNTLKWQLEMGSRSATDFQDHTSRVARGAFSRSVTTSFRETALELSFVTWLEGRRGVLADFLRQAVVSVDEEAVSPLDPSYRVLERSWWHRLAESRDFHYGIRPFRTSPYVFVSKGFWSGDTLLVMMDLRYHYRDLAEHQFECALSVPLARGFALDIGTAYQLRREDEELKMVLKISKKLEHGGIVHVGLDVQEHPRFQVGVSIPL
jgi:hypothetical protein